MESTWCCHLTNSNDSDWFASRFLLEIWKNKISKVFFFQIVILNLVYFSTNSYFRAPVFLSIIEINPKHFFFVWQQSNSIQDSKYLTRSSTACFDFSPDSRADVYLTLIRLTINWLFVHVPHFQLTNCHVRQTKSEQSFPGKKKYVVPLL